MADGTDQIVPIYRRFSPIFQLSAVIAGQENGAEEHSHRAPKRLIFPANRQWKITGTINSTNTSSGKGWTPPDMDKITPSDDRLVVAIGRGKGLIIIVAE